MPAFDPILFDPAVFDSGPIVIVPARSMVSIVGYVLTNIIGIGTVGETLFEGNMPSNPVNAIALFEYGGSSPIRAHAKTIVAERAMLKIMVRNVDYENGYAQIYQAMKELQNYADVVLGVTVLEVISKTPIFSLGRDENGNFMFTVNLQITTRPQ